MLSSSHSSGELLTLNNIVNILVVKMREFMLFFILRQPTSAALNLNDLEWRNNRYFALFYRILQLWGQYVKVVEEGTILSATKV